MIAKHCRSGEAVKVKNAGIEHRREKQHFAEIVLNQWSVLESATTSEVNFPRMETNREFNTIDDMKKKCAVEKVVNLKGKLCTDGCFIVEKNVRGKTKKMMDNCILIDSTGFVRVTLWEDLAEEALARGNEGDFFFAVEDLRLKKYDGESYLTSTNTTVMEKVDPFDVDKTGKQVEDMHQQKGDTVTKEL